MGVMEQILEQLQQLNTKIETLSAVNQEGGVKLIDGKAALSTTEAVELIGIGKYNLLEMARRGRIPHFMNGSNYMFPVKPLLLWMEQEAISNIREDKPEEDFDIMKLTG